MLASTGPYLLVQIFVTTEEISLHVTGIKI